MKTAYFDSISGISGDMILGAFVDLGMKVDHLNNQLKKLDIGDFSIGLEKITRNGISAVKLTVSSGEGEYHRNYDNIAGIIDKSSLDKKVKEISKKVFYRLAEAESKVHQKTIDKVHFHEVGAVDSIIDIVGSAICIEYFGIEKVYSSPLKLGSGVIKSSHGIIPVPAPATLELLSGYPVIKTSIEAELTTPTGAAILTAISSGVKDNLRFVLEKSGYGAGLRELEGIPNLLRIMIGTLENAYQYDDVYLVESNIDDMNPEFYPYIFDRLFKNSALDVYINPVIMKKGRPGNIISVLCEKKDINEIAKVIFSETTTIGLRISEVKRLKLDREVVELSTQFGKVKAKKIYFDGYEHIIPEYDECRLIAEKNNIPLSKVYNIIIKSSSQNIT